MLHTAVDTRETVSASSEMQIIGNSGATAQIQDFGSGRKTTAELFEEICLGRGQLFPQSEGLLVVDFLVALANDCSRAVRQFLRSKQWKELPRYEDRPKDETHYESRAASSRTSSDLPRRKA